MKFNTIRLLPLTALFSLTVFADCSGPYLRNRMRDAKDIFTFEASTRSYGVSARVGPLKAGVSYKDPRGVAAGLRGGQAGVYHSAEFTAMIFGADYFTHAPLVDEEAESEEPPDGTTEKPSEKPQPSPSSNPSPEAGGEPGQDTDLLGERNKEFHARSPFGTSISISRKRSILKEGAGWAAPTYFTQIEITVGAYIGLKIGFNPGELLDFLLGWFTIDIYRDDEPFTDARLRDIQNSPEWQNLDEASRQRIIEELKKQNQ